MLTPYFPFVTKKKNTAKLITNLDNKKAVQSMDMPTKLVLQEFDSLFSGFIASDVNKCRNEGIYVDAFKKAEIGPLHEKHGRTEKSNYRPISVLSNVSKIYERCLHDQIILILIKYFQDINAVFVKVLAHNILLTMVEKIKISRDNKQFCATILTDLSKTFDYTPYDLFIAKLNAYGFDQEALKLIHNYLCDR